jgi:serine/threonine protein kinase
MSGTGARVAVKILAREIGSSVVIDRFLREIRLFILTRSPAPSRKCWIREVTDGLPFYVMTLHQRRIAAFAPRSGKTAPITKQSRLRADRGATSYAHERGIVHRDINRERSALTDGIYVLDFVCARHCESAWTDDVDRSWSGSRLHSPEQATGGQAVDARSECIRSGVCCTR